MLTAIVHLVRHAEHETAATTLIGRGNVSLNANGRREAGELARRFRWRPVRVVQSSPRHRTLETAGPIAAARSVPLEVSAALDEIDYGEWTGCLISDLASDPAWQSWNAARSRCAPPGGESMLAVQERIIRHIILLARTRPDGEIVLVTHAEVIRSVILHALAISADDWSRIAVAPASVNTVEVRGDQLTLWQRETDAC